MGLSPTFVVKPVTDCSLPLYSLVSLLPVMVTLTSSVFGVIVRTPSVTTNVTFAKFVLVFWKSAAFKPML